MKYLIVGLGNIGPEYENTRHNIGFKVLDALAGEFSTFFSSARYGDIATIRHKGRTLVLLKPSTYMNLSGKAVNYWLSKEKLNEDQMLVVTDDLALPFGKIRLRAKGSDGGHNGLKNINELMGTNIYPRLRFGIGDEFGRGQQVSYVLSEWTEDQENILSERIKIATEAILAFTTIGIARTMTDFNGR